jgi:hypothetical protein
MGTCGEAANCCRFSRGRNNFEKASFNPMKKTFNSPRATAARLAEMFVGEVTLPELLGDFSHHADESVFAVGPSYRQTFGTAENYQAELRRAWANLNKKNMTRIKNETVQTKRIVLDVPIELHDRIENYASDQGEAISEVILRLVEAGLPRGTDRNDDADGSREEAQRRLERDGKPASTTIGSDPDNFDSRRQADRTQAAAKLRPLTREERMEIDGQIQSLAFSGRGDAALDLQKVSAAYVRQERKQNAPSIEEQNKSFVDSIVKHGQEIFNGRG